MRKLLAKQLAGRVQELPLAFPARIASLEGDLSAEARVQDGLDLLGDREGAGKGLTIIPGSGSGLRQARLLGPANVRRISMSDLQRAAIRQANLIPFPKAQSIATGMSTEVIRTLRPLRDSTAVVNDGERFLMARPEVRSTEKILELPQRRKSADIRNLKESERQGYLREAEVLKNVPSARADLLAVFRHVPIEVISRLRFVAKRKEILFCIGRYPNCRQTRVHDLAVIRDTASNEVHLVLHRTRSRSVSLIT